MRPCDPCPSASGLFHYYNYLQFTHVIANETFNPFSGWKSISWYICSTFCLSTYQFRGTYLVSIFFTIVNSAELILQCRGPFDIVNLLPLHLCSGVKLLDVVVLFIIIQKDHLEFSIRACTKLCSYQHCVNVSNFPYPC